MSFLKFEVHKYVKYSAKFFSLLTRNDSGIKTLKIRLKAERYDTFNLLTLFKGQCISE